MPTPPDSLFFAQQPAVKFATNTFINVPIILQYDDQPLIEVVHDVPAGYTTQFSIYTQDGQYLAKVKGSRLITDPHTREQYGLQLRRPAGATVCMLGDHPLFRLERSEAAALKTDAHLFTPGGAFIRAWGDEWVGKITVGRGHPLEIGGLRMRNNTIIGCNIGIHIHSDGSIAIGEGSAPPT